MKIWTIIWYCKIHKLAFQNIIRVIFRPTTENKAVKILPNLQIEYLILTP